MEARRNLEQKTSLTLVTQSLMGTFLTILRLLVTWDYRRAFPSNGGSTVDGVSQRHRRTQTIILDRNLRSICKHRE